MKIKILNHILDKNNSQSLLQICGIFINTFTTEVPHFASREQKVTSIFLQYIIYILNE